MPSAATRKPSKGERKQPPGKAPKKTRPGTIVKSSTASSSKKKPAPKKPAPKKKAALKKTAPVPIAKSDTTSSGKKKPATKKPAPKKARARSTIAKSSPTRSSKKKPAPLAKAKTTIGDLFELTSPASAPAPESAGAILDQRLMLPQKVCAIAFNISVEALKKWKVKPRGKLGRETLYYLADLVAYRLERDESGRLNLTDERARLSKVQADRVELELETMRGNLIPADILLQNWEPLVAAARSKFLSLPSKLKIAIPKLTDKDVKKIRKITRSTLENLANVKISKKPS